MTGLIDLTYLRALVPARLEINRLPGYDPAQLQAAMERSQYTLQALIYTLALHRWLRFRSATATTTRDFGGARYLFCRGIDASATTRRHPGLEFDARCMPWTPCLPARRGGRRMSLLSALTAAGALRRSTRRLRKACAGWIQTPPTPCLPPPPWPRWP